MRPALTGSARAVPPLKTVVASPYAGTFPAGFMEGKIGSATITSTGPILAVANEGTSVSVAGADCLGYYDGLAAPLVKHRYPFPGSAYEASAKVTILNAGDQAVAITGTFTCRDASDNTFASYNKVLTAQPGATVDFSPASIGVIPEGKLCAATFTTPANLLHKLAATITETHVSMTPDGATYEGIGL
ncbi:hypothetical protein WME79_03470 [Sorangium sp. So ce726]|uniref:hypothetical protein n=1 Tax=Sorangium sp. So ce726 TaxID=3133319 RepID=UPI003F6069BE